MPSPSLKKSKCNEDCYISDHTPPKKKERKIKAWAVVNYKQKIVLRQFLDGNYAVFSNKRSAKLAADLGDKVTRVEITHEQT